MAEAHYLTAADVRVLRDIARRVRGGRTSERPVARRRRGPQGEGEATSTLRVGKVVTTFVAATSPAIAQPGTVQFYLPNGAPDGPPRSCGNKLPTLFAASTGVYVDMATMEVVTGTCDPYPS